MVGHVIGTDGAGELRIPQDAHDLEEVQIALVRIHFRVVGQFEFGIGYQY